MLNRTGNHSGVLWNAASSTNSSSESSFSSTSFLLVSFSSSSFFLASIRFLMHSSSLYSSSCNSANLFLCLCSASSSSFFCITIFLSHSSSSSCLFLNFSSYNCSSLSTLSGGGPVVNSNCMVFNLFLFTSLNMSWCDTYPPAPLLCKFPTRS